MQYTTTLLHFGHYILYADYDFATLSHTQELEWKKMRTWPCTGSGEVQKSENLTPAVGNCPLLGKGCRGVGGGKKSQPCFWGRAVLSRPAPLGGRCTGQQQGDPELPTSCCGSDVLLRFPHLLLLFLKPVGGK